MMKILLEDGVMHVLKLSNVLHKPHQIQSHVS